ncbi:MAG: ATP-binding protein [Methanomethylophilus sp.]|jgi:predicted AAA+ superfamily ATPase
MTRAKVVRKAYLKRLFELSSQRDCIKIVTGSRYCGKSTLLRQYRDYLVQNGVPAEQIILIGLEDHTDDVVNAVQLESFVKSQIKADDSYLLIDDIHLVPDADTALANLRDRSGLDIVAVLPYADVEAYQPRLQAIGKHELIKILPFSFKEFLAAYPVSDEHGYGERFEQYISAGGSPFTDVGGDPKDAFMVSEGVFNLILNWDIGSQTKIDIAAISRLAIHIFNNVGTTTTLSALRQNSNVTDQRTVEKYLKYLIEYGTVMRADSVDITDMHRLGVKAKYFAVDIRGNRGITPRGAISAPRQNVIDNIVYLELVRRGYEVYDGFYRGSDIGFYCLRGNEKLVVKSVLSVSDERAKGKEFKTFASCPGKKLLLTTDRGMNGMYNGVEYKNVISFLLE